MTKSPFSSVADISSAAILMDAYTLAERGGTHREPEPELPRPAAPRRRHRILAAAWRRIAEIATAPAGRPALAAPRSVAAFGTGFALGAGMVFLIV